MSRDISKKHIIISLATYDKRLNYINQTIHSIINQDLDYAKIFINVPDNSSKDFLTEISKLKSFSEKIEIFLRDYRWRSANKLIWTAKENPDSIIITCDDDIFYKKYFFRKLYEHWLKNQNCIVSHEVSPVFIKDNEIFHVSAYDVKLLQQAYGRYLTGCCLFPPGIMEETDYLNFDLYDEITNCTHDEIWFWIMTTLKKVKSIGLNCTWSFDADSVVLPRDQYSLSKINSDPYLTSYNKKINHFFGKELKEILMNDPCIFNVSNENLMALTGNMSKINQIYGNFPLLFYCDENTVEKSALKELIKAISNFKWNNKIQIKHKIYGN